MTFTPQGKVHTKVTWEQLLAREAAEQLNRAPAQGKCLRVTESGTPMTRTFALKIAYSNAAKQV